MSVFAITGGIACGKSVVTKALAAEGVGIVDADQIARRLVEPGMPALKALVEAFGEGILREGALDRKKLGNLAFASRESLSVLDSIMLPKIFERIEQDVRDRQKTHAMVCLDAPTLIETGLHKLYKPIVLVVAPYQDQLDRVIKRGFTEAEARARIDAQLPTEEKIPYADHVIHNSGNLEGLRASARSVLALIQAGAMA